MPPPAGTLVANGPISGNTIYVRDAWNIPLGSNVALDAIQNNYTRGGGCCRTEVPAPLPLLGVGAAFGFSRNLRKRIKTSKSPEVMSALG